MNTDEIKKEYDRRVNEYLPIIKQVDALVELYKQTGGRNIVRSHTVRVKEWQSFLNKIEEKGCREDEIWEKICDVLGFRIVCIFRSELDIIDEWIKRSFEVIEIETYEWGPIPEEATGKESKKITQSGYTSIHYVVKMLPTDIAKGYKPYKFEIQTRTMLQDAWAEFNHEIYKTKSVPEQIKREKMILSKYLSAMNEHFESIRDSFLKSKPAEEALKSKELEGIDLSGKELMNIDFSGCNLRKGKFVETRLFWCNFDSADLSDTDFEKAQLIHSKIRNAKLVRANLCNTDLSYGDLTGSNLNFANLERAHLTFCDLSNASFLNSKLRYADLSFAVLKKTSFGGSDMRNSHLVYNYYFEEADFTKADLTDAIIAKREKTEPEYKANASRQ